MTSILVDGVRHFYRGGKLVAIRYRCGTVEHYRDGKLHHDAGPAIGRANGTREYWWHGQLHREDGPAVERASGVCEYWYQGKRRFTETPAGDYRLVKFEDGRRDWYQPGPPVSDAEFGKRVAEHLRTSSLDQFLDLCRRFASQGYTYRMVPPGRRKEFLDQLRDLPRIEPEPVIDVGEASPSGCLN